jgi:hypothetical protein
MAWDVIAGHQSAAVPLVDALATLLGEAAEHLARASTTIRPGSHTVYSQWDFCGRYASTPLIERVCFTLTLLAPQVKDRVDIQEVLAGLSSRSSERGGSQVALYTLLAVWPDFPLSPKLQERADWMRVMRAHAGNVVPVDLLPPRQSPGEYVVHTEQTIARLLDPVQAAAAAKEFFACAANSEVEHSPEAVKRLLRALREPNLPSVACSWVVDALSCMLPVVKLDTEVGVELAATLDTLSQSDKFDSLARYMRLLVQGAPGTAAEPVVALLRAFADGAVVFPAGVVPTPRSVLAVLQPRRSTLRSCDEITGELRRILKGTRAGGCGLAGLRREARTVLADLQACGVRLRLKRGRFVWSWAETTLARDAELTFI